MRNLPYLSAFFLTFLVLSSTCKTIPSADQEKLAIKQQYKNIPSSPQSSQDPAQTIQFAQNLVKESLNSTAKLPLWFGELPDDLPFEEILDSKRKIKGSLSMGSVGRGFLLKGTRLEWNGKYHHVISRHQKHKTNYGTKELTDLIRHGAFSVYKKHKGAKLQVGNLSWKKGGDIPWSRSHNSGRDADLAFYMINSKGESVPAPAISKCLEDGSFPRFPGHTFDLPRNWALVESMINHEVGIQWIFISNPLKDKLLRYAEEKGVDETIIRKAFSVLHQPTDALPHDDHFHIRISCPIEDRIEGCLPAGPSWDWLPKSRPYQLKRAMELRKAILSANPKYVQASIEFLARTKQVFRADIALSLLSEVHDPKLRLQLIDLAGTPYSWSDYSLLKVKKAIPAYPNETFLRGAYKIIRRSVNEDSVSFAVKRFQNKELSLAERRLAIQSIRHSEKGDDILKLITLLKNENAELGPTIHTELQFLTNHSGAFADWPLTPEKQKQTLLYWTKLQREFGSDHSKWREAGFKEAGIQETENVDILVAFLENAPDFRAYNANRRLRNLTGRWSPLEFRSPETIYLKWKKWWDRNSPPKAPMALSSNLP